MQLNPAENVPGGKLTATSLGTARRAPVALVGSVTKTARFLYALGGDSGATSGALATIEIASLTPFGDLGTFRAAAKPLPAARTFAGGAAIGRFLYLVGGDTGGGATTSVVRAEVLRTEDTPEIDGDLQIALDPAGLAPGLWYYQVSAVMAGDDADNPGGETLPSEPLPIQVPPWAPDHFRVTFRWTPVAGATQYRIYRSPGPGGGLAGVRLIGKVDAPAVVFSDAFAPADANERPRQLGDLGEWDTRMPSLGTARAEFGLAVATDPKDRAIRHLYAVAGRSAGANVGSYEVLTITLGADGSQAVGASWASGGANTLALKRGLAAYAADATVNADTFDLDETWIYAGSGIGTAADAARFQSARVLAGGLLGNWQTAFTGNVGKSGYGGVAASSQLFVMGGSSTGAPSDDRDSGLVQAGGFLNNVNATSFALDHVRALMGATLGSGRIFLVGGVDGAGALKSIESSVW